MRIPFAATVDQRPVAVAVPRDPADVAAVLAAARADGLRVAPQRSGHAAETLDLDGAILLRTDRMAEVAVDPVAGTARVGAGALTGDLVAAAARHGLGVLAGSSPTVGVVGFHLGGGLSFAGRRHGLAAATITAVELVAPDGRWLRATAAAEPDVLWAARGRGGGLGVVTALELRLPRLGPVQAGNLLFPLERAREVGHAWRELTLTAPDGLCLALRAMRPPPPPGSAAGGGPTGPDGAALGGRAVAGDLVAVTGLHLGAEDEAAELLAPLRALGPEIDTFAARGPEALCEIHMDPREPSPAIDDHLLLDDPLPAVAVDAFVDAVGPGSGSCLALAELRQTGGAMRSPSAGGVSPALPGGHFVFASGLVGDGPGMAERPHVEADIARVVAALAPWAVGRGFMNFSDRPLPAAAFLPLEDGERLRALSRRWDPEGALVTAHPADPR
ncbi:MAG: FAD-dependent oxidoreductase [Solirubrobacterales bacterium]|nr:FAD-dependent oxidoreductase [Solirubrobacterales bacterium]